MQIQIWSKSEQKWAYILVLRGDEVHRLKVTGNMLTLKRNVKAVLEALEQGRPPAEAGAKAVESLDVRTISKADVDPGNGSLTLWGDGESPKKLQYATGDSDADAILKTVLERAGRAFAPTQEEVTAVEAVVPPVIIGGIAAVLWFLVRMTAADLAAGKQVEAHGRRRGMQQMLIWAAELLGVNGTLAVGVVGLALIVGWAAMRLIKRPQRTVWLPE